MQSRRVHNRDEGPQDRKPSIHRAGTGDQLPHILPLEQTVEARYARDMPGPNLSATSAYRQAMFMRTGMMSEIPWVTSPSSSRRSSLRRAGSVDVDRESASMGMQTPPRYSSVPLRSSSPLVPDAGEESEFTDGGSERRGSTRRRRSKQFGGPLTTLPIISYEKRKKGKGRSRLHDSDREEWEYSTGDEGSEQHSQRSSTLVQNASESPFTTPPPVGAAPSPESQQREEHVSDVDELDVVDRPPPVIPPAAPLPMQDDSHENENNNNASEHERNTHAFPPPRETGPRYRFGLILASTLAALNSRLDANSFSTSRAFDATSTFVGRAKHNVSTAWTRAKHRRRYGWSDFMTLFSVCLLIYAVFHEVNRFSNGSPESTYLMKALSIVPMGNVEGLAERLAAMQREMATIHSDVYSMRQALSGVHAHEHHAMKQFAEVQRDQHTLLERMVLIESQIEKEIRQLQLHNDSQYALLSSEGQNLLSLKNMLMDALGELRGYDVQRPDYALYSNGANVIGYLTHPQGSLKPSFFSSLKRGATVKPREPETALHHDTNPGHCWPFRGTRGQLGVRLLKPVHIDAVTVDHAKMEQTIDMASAPRWMEVWGRVEGKENLERWEEYRKRFEPDVADGEVVETQVASHSPKTEHEPHVLHLPRLPNGDQYVRIASFEFNANSRRNIQTFSVLQDALDLGITFQTVVLNIDGNWGNDEYTCLYRFRVHGSVEVNSSHM